MRVLTKLRRKREPSIESNINFDFNIMIIRFLFLCVRFRRRQWAALVSWLHHPEKLILAREVEERLNSTFEFIL